MWIGVPWRRLLQVKAYSTINSSGQYNCAETLTRVTSVFIVRVRIHRGFEHNACHKPVLCPRFPPVKGAVRES